MSLRQARRTSVQAGSNGVSRTPDGARSEGPFVIMGIVEGYGEDVNVLRRKCPRAWRGQTRGRRAGPYLQMPVIVDPPFACWRRACRGTEEELLHDTSGLHRMNISKNSENDRTQLAVLNTEMIALPWSNNLTFTIADWEVSTSEVLGCSTRLCLERPTAGPSPRLPGHKRGRGLLRHTPPGDIPMDATSCPAWDILEPRLRGYLVRVLSGVGPQPQSPLVRNLRSGVLKDRDALHARERHLRGKDWVQLTGHLIDQALHLVARELPRDPKLGPFLNMQPSQLSIDKFAAYASVTALMALRKVLRDELGRCGPHVELVPPRNLALNFANSPDPAELVAAADNLGALSENQLNKHGLTSEDLIDTETD